VKPEPFAVLQRELAELRTEAATPAIVSWYRTLANPERNSFTNG
jgi:hypothetical protein